MTTKDNPQTSTAALMSGEPLTNYSDDIEGMPDLTEEGQHLDGFVAADADDAGDIEHDVVSLEKLEEQQQDAGEGDKISRDAFWIVFSTAFNMPGMVLPALQPLGIQEHEQQPARAACDATYSLLEIYLPKALHPLGDTFAHLMLAGPFLVGKMFVAATAFRAMRQPAPEPARAANENGPPAGRVTPSEPGNKPANDQFSWMDQEAAA